MHERYHFFGPPCIAIWRWCPQEVWQTHLFVRKKHCKIMSKNTDTDVGGI